MRTAYITHPIFLLHDPGQHHPECAERLRAIDDRLISARLMDLLRHYEARPATREQLLRVHTQAHIEHLEARSPREGYRMLDADTIMSKHTLEAAYHAAGGAILATELVVEGKVDNAFCAIRPPGHHAERHRAMGFCLFNNVAVAAAHALAECGLERVAIVDFDIHNGNGTEDIFRDDDRVMFCSSFQHPFYPYTPLHSDSEHIVHIPLKAGVDSATFQEAISSHCFPALERFKPQIIFISAGFDGHIEDDMSGGKLLDQDYVWITDELMKIADKYASGRIVSCLEGGYELHALARSATLHIQSLMSLQH